MRHLIGVAALSLVTPTAFAASAHPENQAQPELRPPEAKPAPANSAVTRQHLTAALLRFERALRDHPPTKDRLAAVNRDFDAATLLFFSGDFPKALESLNNLAASLIYGAEIPPAARFAASLKAATDPVVWNLSGSLDITVTSIYNAPSAPGPILRIMANGGEIMSQEPVGSVPFWSGYDTNGLVTKARQTGPDWMYRVEILSGADVLDSVRLFTVSGSLDTARDNLLARLKTVQASTPEMTQAIAACRSRANLLSDKPSPNDSSQFLTDLITLRNDLEREVSIISAGRDPYIRRPGDYWRTITAAGIDVPCRIYAPSATTDSTRPHPVLVALHGAGGDESMFFEAYGAGRTKQLADQHGLIVLCPRTEPLMGPSRVFDDLLDGLALDYNLDRSRIYILGHSLGGFTAASLASTHADRIAAACCIAGYAAPSTKSAAPSLVLAGALDQIVPAAKLKSAADSAAKSGLPVEFRPVEDQGHTLIVADQLPAAIDWLLTHQSPERKQGDHP